MRPLPRWAGPTDWPLTRIRENLEARLKEDEGDVSAHFNLGRAYAYALSQERTSLDVMEHGELVVAPRQWPANRPGTPLMPPPTAALKLELLKGGLHHLRRAIDLAEAPVHHLSLAVLLEAGVEFAVQIDTGEWLFPARAPSPEERVELESQIAALGSTNSVAVAAARRSLEERLELAAPFLQAELRRGDPARAPSLEFLLERACREQAISEYWRAFELAAAQEGRQSAIVTSDAPTWERIVPEALENYRRLVLARGAREEEARQIEEAELRLQTLNQKVRPGPITPLLLSLREGCPSLDELTTPNLTVPFDLDGDAIDELWPWLAPDAGWLVWDPERRGEITSGLQLFGSASAWLFFADGYRVLDALDDDRDGELRNQELAGLAVWFDRDTDGVSDPGEVVPVEELGLVALATEATERIGPSLGNPAGAELASGRVLPTYDWVLSPANSSAQQ